MLIPTMDIQALLLAAEEDLRTSRAAVTAMRTMGMSADPVAPEAILVVSRLAEEALERITASWNQALSATKAPQMQREASS